MWVCVGVWGVCVGVGVWVFGVVCVGGWSVWVCVGVWVCGGVWVCSCGSIWGWGCVGVILLEYGCFFLFFFLFLFRRESGLLRGSHGATIPSGGKYLAHVIVKRCTFSALAPRGNRTCTVDCERFELEFKCHSIVCWEVGYIDSAFCLTLSLFVRGSVRL